MAKRDGVATYILAGGQSSRMGRDKALLDFGGVPLILHIASLVQPLTGPPVIIGRPDRYANLKLRVIPDDAPGVGPLGGIATALRDSREPWNLILGCDMPLLTSEWIAHLIARALSSDADAIVPQSANGAEPLCAMYRKSCEASIAKAVARGVRKVTDGISELSIERIEPQEWREFDSSGLLFRNLNSPRDIED
ncbi:MAG: molybdenum cofactor guanylyltransferase, partial [Candidatus Acidiferrales bacterium]